MMVIADRVVVVVVVESKLPKDRQCFNVFLLPHACMMQMQVRSYRGHGKRKGERGVLLPFAHLALLSFELLHNSSYSDGGN
jgi:hypothetical protein